MANEFLPFATNVGANVITQAAYAALAARTTGFQPGLAQSAQANKAWRQAAFGTAALGELISTLTGTDALDDGNLATFVTNLQAAVRAAAGGIPVLAAITGAAATYTAAQNGKLVVRTNGNTADNTMVDTLPGTAPGILVASSIINVFNGDLASILVVKAGVGATLKTATGYCYVGPLQSASFISDGTNYWPVQKPDRCRLAANTTVYVSGAGSNANHGFLVGSPFLTRQKAWDTLQQQFDLNGLSGIILLANGTYADTFVAGAAMTGAVSPSSIVFNGNANPALVVIQTVNVDCFQAGPYAAFFVQGMTLQTTGTGGGIHALDQSYVQFGNIAFGAMTGGVAHIRADGGKIFGASPYSITGGSGCHLNASGPGSRASVAGLNVSVGGTPAFSQAFAKAEIGAQVLATGAVFTGAATGQRYNSTFNSNIITGGGGANHFPGNVAGVADAATFATYS